MSNLMLPVDVVRDILSHLPVKSLLRLTCLSKYFSSLIHSPNFIDSHLNLSIKTTTNRSLIVNDTSQSCGSIYEVDLDSSIMCAAQMDLQHIRLPFIKHTCYGNIFGTCNGLVAMNNDQGIILWNPSTRKHQIVPKFWKGEVCFNNGFGYDVITNDYKVIVITSDNNDNYSTMVYSLKTNSSKRIHNTPPPDYFEYYKKLHSVLVGSCVHWLVAALDDEVDFDYMILAFDLGNEKFNEVPTPDVDDDFKVKMVAELGGCISINYACYFREGIDIWIMKEYGVKESWIKLFSLFSAGFRYNSTSNFVKLKPLCYTKKGDKVLCNIGDGLYYILYDLKNRMVESVDIITKSLQFLKPLWMDKPGVICVRSLVPLSLHNTEET